MRISLRRPEEQTPDALPLPPIQKVCPMCGHGKLQRMGGRWSCINATCREYDGIMKTRARDQRKRP